MNFSISAKTVGLWKERLVLMFLIGLLSVVWGISFTNEPAFENALNSKVTMFIVLSALTMTVTGYGYYRSKIIATDAFGSINVFFARHQWWLILIFFISYLVVMSSVALLRHQSFQTHAFDLAIFDQAIWSVLNGRFLYSSFKGGICLLGDHMSPVLVLFSPLYWIWNDARILLVAQAVIAAVCFFPLALIAQEKLGKGMGPIVFAFALFFYQPLRHSVRSDFHPEILSNPIILFAFYFLIKEKWNRFFSTLLLLVLCKENMYGMAFAFGIYFLLGKRIRVGMALMFASVIFFYLTTQILVPKLAGSSRYFYQANYSYLFTGNWGDHPPLIVQPLEALEYLYKIYLPLGFLSFAHFPTWILTVPILLQNLLSRNPAMHSIAYQYTSGLTAAIFTSAIFGMAKVFKHFDRKVGESTLRTILFGSTMILSLALAGRPERTYFLRYKQMDNGHKAMVRELIGKIPRHLSVVANETLAPRLSHRFEIHQFEDYQRMPETPTYFLEADVVILDRELIIGNIQNEVEKVKSSGYKVLREKDGFYILGRRDLGEVI